MKLPRLFSKLSLPSQGNVRAEKQERRTEMDETGRQVYFVKYRSRQFRMAIADRDDVVQENHVRGVFYETE